MATTTLSVFITLLVVQVATQADFDIYYVKPSHNSSLPYACPATYPCHTLQYYVENEMAYFKSNSTFQFLPGIHILESNEGNEPTTIKNVQNLTLIGNDTFIMDASELPIPSSQIHCNGSGGLLFAAVRGLFIGNLMLSTCGAVLPWPFDGRFRAALAIGLETPQESTFDVTITRVVIQNSTGHGLYGSNVLGNSSISESTFTYNMFNYNGSQEYYGGNIRLSYWYCPEYAGNSTFTIQSSYLLHGYNPYPNESNTSSAGLSITIGLRCFNIIINVTNVTARHNVGYTVGNFEIIWYSNNITNFVHISRCVLEDGLVTGANQTGAGGLSIFSELGFQPGAGDVLCGHNSTVHMHHFVTVTDTTFTNNTAVTSGAVTILQEHCAIVCAIRIITFENCLFTNNTSINGTTEAVLVAEASDFGIPIYDDPFSTQLSSQYVDYFHNCTFRSSAISGKSLSETNANVVLVYSAKNVVFTNCTFIDNIGTAIAAIESVIIFEGNITFKNNTGTNGGALFFCEDSAMYLRKNTSINFWDNHALHSGGAIYAQDECLTNTPPLSKQYQIQCFLRPVNVTETEGIHFHFQNNTAKYAGSVLYGGTVDKTSCFVDKLFDINNTKFSRSQVSSDPIGVIFCDDKDDAPD